MEINMNIEKLTQDELDEIIRLHSLWLEGKEEGIKADLSFTDLSFVNLSGVNLSKADLRKANLRKANLTNTNLTNADLSYADLRGAKMKNINLQNVHLFYTLIDNMVGIGNLGIYGKTAYYFYKDDRVICDNFDGTLEEFEKMVGMDCSYYNAIELFQKFRKREIFKCFQ